MGYDQIVAGPEDMLRLQITEDAQAAREAAAANGTNVFQAVRKLQATVDAVQQVVLDQQAVFNELVARFSASQTGADRNHSIPNGQRFASSYDFDLPGPDVDRYALLSFGARFTKTGSLSLSAFIGMNALGNSLYRSTFQQFPDTRQGVQPTGFGATVPIQVPAGQTLSVELEYFIDNYVGSTQTAQVRDVLCSVMYGAPVE